MIVDEINMIHSQKGNLFSRRLGTFEVSLVDIDDDLRSENLKAVFNGFVPLRVEYIFHLRVLSCVGLHEEFAVIPEGGVAVPYVPEMTRHEDGSITRRFIPVGIRA